MATPDGSYMWNIAVKRIAELFCGSPPEELHHYTSQEALLGIQRTRVLFLTDTRYLNDSSETEYGLELVRQAAKRSDETYNRPASNRFAEKLEAALALPPLPAPGATAIVPELVPTTDGLTYVGSLSADPDLLSQWRAYATSPAGGCCISFRSETLVSKGADPVAGPVLRRVVYMPKEQDDLLDKLFKSMFDARPEDSSRAPYFAASALRRGILPMLVPLLKAEGFKEENEWRIVTSAQQETHFRVGPLGITPYCLHPLGNPILPHPIVGVRFPRGPHAELQRAAILRLLPRAKVTLSELSLRPK